MTRDAIVGAARGWLGTPYRHQASLKGVGCDCLGLLRGLWRDLIGPEPEAFRPYSPDWAETCGSERLLDAARRHLVAIDLREAAGGDVVFFRWRAHLPAKHCAVLTGPSTMIHAHDGAAVTEVALSAWWRRRLAGVFQFPGLHA